MTDELLTILHDPEENLLTFSREEAEVYLNKIAKALLKGWEAILLEIATTTRFLRKDRVSPESIKTLLRAFQAEESTRGVMKNAIFINHQWVIKLGANALNEAIYYQEADKKQRDLYVPTVQLGNFGCLQLKVEIPRDNDLGFFETNKHEDKWHTLKDDIPDCHRGNVGIWQNKLYCLDFAGTKNVTHPQFA